MSVQYIHDNKGKPTGVFIPISDWKNLKKKYTDLQFEESKPTIELQDWHKEIIDQRLADYEKNPKDNVDFEEMIARIEKDYDL